MPDEVPAMAILGRSHSTMAEMDVLVVPTHRQLRIHRSVAHLMKKFLEWWLTSPLDSRTDEQRDAAEKRSAELFYRVVLGGLLLAYIAGWIGTYTPLRFMD